VQNISLQTEDLGRIKWSPSPVAGSIDSLELFRRFRWIVCSLRLVGLHFLEHSSLLMNCLNEQALAICQYNKFMILQ